MRSRAHTEREMEAYRQLEKVYASSLPDAEKAKEKTRIIDELVADLRMRRRPNNANLVELRVYLASYGAFDDVAKACGSTAALIAAAKGAKRSDFEKPLQEDFSKVMVGIQARCSRHE